MNFIEKSNDKPSEMDNYLHYVACYMGLMNILANTIEVYLNDILERLKVNNKPRTLGSKISLLKSLEKEKSVNIPVGLIRKLEEFNHDWNICKHGIPIGSNEVLSKPITCPIMFDKINLWKDGIPHTFDKEKIKNNYDNFGTTLRILKEFRKKNHF